MANIPMPLIGGYLIDKIGIRAAPFIILTDLVIGQFLFALGISISSYSLALIARVIMGICGETIFVWCSVVVTRWFKYKGLAFGLAIMNTGLALGNLVNDYLTPAIYKASNSVPLPFWISATVVGFSFGFAVFVVVIETKAQRIDKLEGVIHQVIINIYY